MVARAAETAAPLVPDRPSLKSLRAAAAGCTACPLWEGSTQTVFGEGLKRARLMLVGEQPGDREDLEGRPFVGPAGRLLARGLEAAGIERDEAYLTNVVKHFKFEYRGKRRIHKKPNMSEVTACAPWLRAEIEVVKPRVVMALGATAAQALFGRDFKVSQRRGEVLDVEMAEFGAATVHPSSILRSDDRKAQFDYFVRDLAAVARLL